MNFDQNIKMKNKIFLLSWLFFAVSLQSVYATEVIIVSKFSMHEVNENFLSFSVDSGILSYSPKWFNFNFSSPFLQALMTGLSPATLRFGGSSADWTVFADNDAQADILNTTKILPPISVFTKSDLDNMINLTLKTGTRFLYDLNLQLRYGTQWDPNNALKMFDYMQSKGYGSNVDFELGNEPACYNKPGEISVIPPDTIGKDYVRLHRLMSAYPNLKDSRLFGPDVVAFGNQLGQDILNQVAEISGGYLHGLTFHHYYFRGDTANVQDYLNASHFSNLDNTIEQARKIIANTSNPNIDLWLGETSDAWHGGTPNVSDKFVSGFLWLDKLGLAAKSGISGIIRQELYAKSYGLLDLDMTPNPDYWLSWLYKNLVGTKVLDAVYWGGNVTTRVYAHCTNFKRSGKKQGSVTMFALNMHPNYTDALMLYPPFEKQTVETYIFTPSPNDPRGILSKYAAVNGQTLRLKDDFTFPKLRPLVKNEASMLKLPPLTIAFYVFPKANAPACL